MNLHPNSLTAYRSTASQRESIEAMILDLMADKKPRTDRQIAVKLGIENRQYRPRVKELCDKGELIEVGSTVCEFTGRKARLTKRFL